MKKTVIAVLSAALFAAAISAFADDTQSVDACEKIRQACRAGGYVEDGTANGNDLVVDCINPLMRWENVPGVSIDKAVIQQCRDSLRHHLRQPGKTPKPEQTR